MLREGKMTRNYNNRGKQAAQSQLWNYLSFAAALKTLLKHLKSFTYGVCIFHFSYQQVLECIWFYHFVFNIVMYAGDEENLRGRSSAPHLQLWARLAASDALMPTDGAPCRVIKYYAFSAFICEVLLFFHNFVVLHRRNIQEHVLKHRLITIQTPGINISFLDWR